MALGWREKKELAGGVVFTVPCVELSMHRKHTCIISVVSLVSHTIVALSPHQLVRGVGVSYAVANACLAVPSFAA